MSWEQRSSDGASAPELDLHGLLGQIHGNRAAMVRLLTLLRDAIPERRRQLAAALAAEDGLQLQRVAHALKGSLASFGAATSRGHCADVERWAAAGDFAAAADALAALQPRLDAAAAEVEAWLRAEVS